MHARTAPHRSFNLLRGLADKLLIPPVGPTGERVESFIPPPQILLCVSLMRQMSRRHGGEPRLAYRRLTFTPKCENISVLQEYVSVPLAL